MTNDHGSPRSHLSRRQLLKAGGLTLGALAVGRRAPRRPRSRAAP